MTQGTIEEFLDMVTYRRPHESEGEQAFIDRFILPLNPVWDKFGNYMVTVGTDPKTMFSCHLDTVHRDDKRQQVCYDADFGMAYKDDNEPLGADDAAGIWLYVNMIRRGVPGLYIFHRGEECGGLGSDWRAEKKSKWAKTFDRAIAFDRKANTSIITHQGGDRCCSDEFGKALIEQFRLCGLPYELDTGGVFTDTANYTHLIPECTNISVGYIDEHKPAEMQDTAHLAALLEACCTIKWDELPTVRVPVAKPVYGSYYCGGSYSSYKKDTGVKWYTTGASTAAANDQSSFLLDGAIPSFTAVADFVWREPDRVAELIHEWIEAGYITAQDLPELFGVDAAEDPPVADPATMSLEAMLVTLENAEAELAQVDRAMESVASKMAFMEHDDPEYADLVGEYAELACEADGMKNEVNYWRGEVEEEKDTIRGSLFLPVADVVTVPATPGAEDYRRMMLDAAAAV